MRGRSLLATMLLGAGASAARAGELWQLTSADFSSRSVQVVSIDDRAVTIASPADAAQQSLPWTQVLGLDRSSLSASVATPADLSVHPTPEPFVLYLNGGDHIPGSLRGVADDQVRWSSSSLGAGLSFSEDRVNAIARNGVSVPGLDLPRDKDLLRLTNGDQVSGILQGVTGAAVSIQAAGADAPTQIPLTNVQAIVLADSNPRQVPTHRDFRLTLADDLVLAMSSLAVSPDGTVHCKAEGSSDLLTFAMREVRRIEQINGPVQWLTAQSPEIDYRPFLDESFPPQFEHTVADPVTPLTVHYPAFHHGIGVHSFTRLTYAIPAGYSAFRTQYAIDPISGVESTRADVTLRLLLDGKVRWEEPHVRSGPPGGPAQIELDGAKSLALEVDYGENVAAQDRLTWLDPAFIRAMSAPATQPAVP